MSDKPKEVSGEVEGDPMAGVKEIKGADAPREPEVKIDIAKHQDAEDADSAKNETTQTSGSHNSLPQATQTETVRSEVKTSHKKRNLTLFIILGFCFLCLICCLATFAMKDQVLKLVTNSANRQDSTLTTVTTDDVKSSEGDIGSLLEQKKAEGRASSIDGSYTIDFTEEELLSSIFKSSEGIDPSSIALKFETGKAKVQIDVGKIIASQKENLKNSEQLKNLPIDLSLLNGVIVSADVTTNADGSKLKFENVSTGNSFLDTLIPPDVIKSLGDEIDLSKMFQSQDGDEVSSTSKIERIQFVEGQMLVTMRD